MQVIPFIAPMIVTTVAISFLLQTRWVNVFLDTPDKRKMHQRLVPRMGGFGIMLGVIPLWLIWGHTPIQTVLALSALGIMVLGLLDDSSLLYYLINWFQKKESSAPLKFDLRVRYKLILEFGITIAALFFLKLVPTQLHFYHWTLDIPLWIGWPITVLWTIGVMNAFNLIDGIDGLCGGVSVLSLTAVAILGFSLGRMDITLAAVALASAGLGFLFHNHSPAKVFMGDMGSLFMGFSIAILGLSLLQNTGRPVDTLVILLLAGHPVLDVGVAIFRRFTDVPRGAGLKPRLKRIVSADSNHMHHRLLYLGLTHNKASLILYSVATMMLLGALSLAWQPMHTYWSTLIYQTGAIGLIVFVLYFHDNLEAMWEKVLLDQRTNGKPFALGVILNSPALQSAFAASQNHPFLVNHIDYQAPETNWQRLDGLVIEHTEETTDTEFTRFFFHIAHSTHAPIALITDSAETFRQHPDFNNQCRSQITFYSRPIYTWPLLLSLLEKLLEKRHATSRIRLF